MHSRLLGVTSAAALTLTLASCSDPDVVGPTLDGGALRSATVAAGAGVRLSEIHYDNDGTDVGEAVEIVGPAGTDLTGWSLVLYNGNGGAAYDTDLLTGTIPATCGAEGVVVVDYPSNGIQNGSPDGVALVDASGAVVEFLSYEGSFSAVGGPANGMTSTDIGVAEASTTPAGYSLQRDGSGTWQAPAPATFGACNAGGASPPPPPPPPSSGTLVTTEILADPSAVTDANGEWFEIHNPGTQAVDLRDWQLVSKNDATHTVATSLVVPAGGYAVLARNGDSSVNGGVAAAYAYGALNLANSADWIVLRNPSGEAVDSVEWKTAGRAGASRALIDAAADNSDVDGANWTDAEVSFGAGDRGTLGARNASASASPIVIHEILAQPLAATGGASWGEWFEVHNTGSVAVDLQGWTIASGGQASHTVGKSVVVPAGGYAVLGRGYDPNRNGGIELDYNYYSGASTIWLDDSDWLVLRDAAGITADSVAWSSVNPGVSRGLRDAGLDNADVDGASWGFSTVRFGNGDFGTPDAGNGTLSDTPPSPGEPGVVTRVTLSRFGGDYWVPAGYQKPLFATAYDALGNRVDDAQFAWSSSDPSVATVDPFGYVTGVAPGTATITAVTPNGVQAAQPFTVRPGSEPTSAIYRDHLEFGTPTDATPADDYVLAREQFVVSYNSVRGGPNWAAWNLNASHFGPEDRCECFTPDPQLPAGMKQVTDYDYRNSGYSRGHMVMSKNRTTTGAENATTFLMTNILPQASNNNSGPWLGFEIFLNQLAEQGKEIYIIAGGDYSANPQTLRGEGKVQIPEFTWKIAAVLDAGEGLESVDSWDDLTVYAIRTPNDTVDARNIKGDSWEQHQTTVDAIEARTGYDFLDLLPDLVERIVESGTRAPVATTDGPYTGTEGTAVTLNASASSDPDGDALTFAWDFGDGTTGTGPSPSHTYTDNGNFPVTVTVTDVYGAASTATTRVTVVNVAPALVTFAGATLLQGESYSAAGAFTDPGAGSWTATVNFGDGSGIQPLALSGKNFSLAHVYAAAGTYTVSVSVTDDDGESATSTATVTVQTPRQGIQALSDRVDGLAAAGTLSAGNANALNATLNAAAASLDRGNRTAAVNQMNAFINQVAGLVRGGSLPAAEGQALTAEANRIIRGIHRL